MPTQLKNISPLGDLLVPGIGLVPKGSTITTDDQSLITNTSAFAVITPSTTTTAAPTSAVASPTTQE